MPQQIPDSDKYDQGPISRPSAGDDGETWARLIEEFMDLLGSHNHDGDNSRAITANFEKVKYPTGGGYVTPSFNNNGDGTYTSDPLPYPSGVTASNQVSFYYSEGLSDNVNQFYPTLIYEDVNNYRIKINKSSLTFRAEFF